MPLTGICMCGHPSSVHTAPGGGCAAKYTDHKGRQVECDCSSFCDRGEAN